MTALLNGKLEKIDFKEALGYLGYQSGSPVSDEVEGLLLSCGEEILKAQTLRAVYAEYPVRQEGDALDLGFARVKSASLARNLVGCEKIVLFAATAGAGIDRLVAAYSRVSPVRAAVAGALGSALIEGWCDRICGIIKERYGDCRPRFSCGYGDLPLELQRDIFAALNVTRSIGVNLSDNCFMTPVKSVTAIVGIKKRI